MSLCVGSMHILSTCGSKPLNVLRGRTPTREISVVKFLNISDVCIIMTLYLMLPV